MPAMVAHICNPRTREAKTEKPGTHESVSPILVSSRSKRATISKEMDSSIPENDIQGCPLTAIGTCCYISAHTETQDTHTRQRETRGRGRWRKRTV